CRSALVFAYVTRTSQGRSSGAGGGKYLNGQQRQCGNEHRPRASGRHAIFCNDVTGARLPSGLRDRLSQPRRPQRGLVRPPPGATASQITVDYHGGHRADAQALGPTCDFRVFHVEHTDLAGRAGDALDHLHRLLADRATGAEDLYFSFRSHDENLLWGMYRITQSKLLTLPPSSS